MICRPALQVVTLIGGVTHGEGFAWESAIVDDGAEELVLAHSLKEEAHGGVILDQRAQGILAVDVIHLHFGMLLGVQIEEALKRANRQLLYGMGGGEIELLG